MNSISNKVRWIVGILSLNLVLIIAVNIWLNNDQELDAKIINVAGKQRMLSQRTVLELHRLLVNEEGSFERLQEARDEFDRNYAYLKEVTAKHQGFSNEQIRQTMHAVGENWNVMRTLIDRYLLGENNLYDLKVIYDRGTQTLGLMDSAVTQYESHIMEKRILASRIQIALAILSFAVILYMARLVLGIQKNFNQFIAHSQQISGQSTLGKVSGNELDIACAHIEYFLQNVEETLQSATEAIEKSELFTVQALGASPESDALLEQSEDMMLQLSEELHQSANHLKKLKKNLQNAQSLRDAKA